MADEGKRAKRECGNRISRRCLHSFPCIYVWIKVLKILNLSILTATHLYPQIIGSRVPDRVLFQLKLYQWLQLTILENKVPMYNYSDKNKAKSKGNPTGWL